MTAQPVSPPRFAPSFPAHHRQLAADYTIEDLLDLPPHAPRVETVTPETRHRDHLEKPGLCAGAYISHFWRIEPAPLRVFAHDLVGDHYELVADSGQLLSLSEPFDLELPIRDITP